MKMNHTLRGSVLIDLKGPSGKVGSYRVMVAVDVAVLARKLGKKALLNANGETRLGDGSIVISAIRQGAE